MIKCNVTACGTISRDASMRITKEDKTFLTFPLHIMIQGKGDRNKTVETSVNKEGTQKRVSSYRNRLHVEAAGALFLKRRGEKLYFNLSADHIATAKSIADSIKGELSFRDKVGENIEEWKNKRGKSYTVFSAFSIEKVGENFEYRWVHFFCFDRQREEWLQSDIRIGAKDKLTVSAHSGKPDISCRVEESAQYVPGSDNSNQ